ncbi:hypothetical protein F4775DRAFT_550530 [Biscogniauxia sp. FL1348]|nr:hypothetical protein F4775DRAFT_550530 [Biscogniauxia sp. FL1348]
MKPATSGMTLEDTRALSQPRLHSPWKRLACDRCRTMKLRCPRTDGDSMEACTRCIRCRVPCFTSSPKPPGRPPHKRSTSTQRSVEKTTDSVVFDSRQQTTGELHGVDEDTDINESNNDSLQFLHHSPVDAALNSSDFPGSHHTQAPGASIPCSGRETLSSNFLSELVNTWPMISAQDTVFCDQEMDTTGDGSATRSLISDDTLTSASARDSDPGILLSNLQADLSGQLFRVKSVPWDLQILSNTCALGAMGKGEDDADGSLQFNPFTAVLNSTGVFIDVIRVLESSVMTEDLSSSLGSEFRDQPSPYKSSSGGSSSSSNMAFISTAHQLTIFSCYLQLLSIYQEILHRLLDSLLGKPDQIGYDRRPVVGLCFAGYLVRGELLCRLVSQVVEYQLELVERSLGLPRQYCVSSNRQKATYHVNVGLLRGMEGNALFGAVMAAAPEGGEGSGSRVVTLVREQLKMLQQVSI